MKREVDAKADLPAGLAFILDSELNASNIAAPWKRHDIGGALFQRTVRVVAASVCLRIQLLSITCWRVLAMTANDALPVELKTIPDGNLQRINILLKEYDTLRSELQQRTAAGFALVGIVVAAAGWSLSQTLARHYYTSAVVVFLIVCFLFFGPRFINVQIRRCAERVQRIEKRINFLAQDQLLEWESRWGMGATGHHLRDEFPPDLQADQKLPPIAL